MMKVRRLVAVAAAVAMVAAIALPAMAAKPVSVGRFVQELAKAKNLNATDPEIAVESLTAVGVRLPADLEPAHLRLLRNHPVAPAGAPLSPPHHSRMRVR